MGKRLKMAAGCVNILISQETDWTEGFLDTSVHDVFVTVGVVAYQWRRISSGLLILLGKSSMI